MFVRYKLNRLVKIHSLALPLVEVTLKGLFLDELALDLSKGVSYPYRRM